MAVGDSLADPKPWVGGTNTYADTRVSSTDIFYSLPLVGGVNYNLGVNSGAFDTYMELYNTIANGQASIDTDDDDGAGSNALINYTPPVTGIYYIRASAFTPTDSGAFSVDSDLVLNYPPKTIMISNAFNMLSNFRLTYAMLNNAFNIVGIRKAKINNRIQNFNNIKRKKINNAFNLLNIRKALINNRFEMNRIGRALGLTNHHRIWSKKGYEIFANGVLIGFMAEGVTTLTDIPLADGDYEIVAKPLGNFYRHVEVNQMLRINCDSGGSGVSELFPLIYDLLTVINSARTYLSWSIIPQVTSNSTKIGLWFGASSGIVITGAPDVSFSIGEYLTFKYSFKQSIAQWAAVACYDGANRGTKTEIELPWSTTLPDAPEFQHIEE
mgnify:CR=1 FL=1